MTHFRRKKLFVDPRVQGALVLRTVGYWFALLLTITSFLIAWRIVTGPARPVWTHFDDLWFHYAPAAIAGLLMLPLAAYDVIKLSNRFVGPMVRIRDTLRKLGRGEACDPVTFRDKDFWLPVAEELNTVIARLARLEKTNPSSSPSVSPLDDRSVSAS